MTVEIKVSPMLLIERLKKLGAEKLRKIVTQYNDKRGWGLKIYEFLKYIFL